jgi:tetratricopeptide (TPR) repeat protein
MILLTSPSVIWTYLQHLVVPWPLSFIYNNTYIERFGRDVFIPVILLLAIAAALFWWGRRSRRVLFCCAWILLMLLPVLNLGALVQGEVVHDRYLYLPSAAFSIIAALGLYRLARLVSRVPRLRVLAGASVAVALIFAVLNLVQAPAWSDEIALYTRACKVAPRNAHAMQELAYAMARSGNCQEAYPLLAQLAELNPWVAQTPFFQGSCYLQDGRLGAAEPFLLRALELEAGYQPALLDLAWIYAHTGRLDEAEKVWTTAAERTPHPEVALFAIRADILRARGDLAGAEEQIRRALDLQPDNQGFRAQLKELEAKRVQERSAVTALPLEHRPSE